MYISKTRFLNWTRCPLYIPLDLKHNPEKKTDIDEERERREEKIAELVVGMNSSTSDTDEDDEFDASPSEELEALLPYYNRVEDEALKVAKKYFRGSFVSDSKDVHGQKLFEYGHNGHTYRCYVDIYNESKDEINIIEVKATTCKKFSEIEFADAPPRKHGGKKYPLLIKNENIWRLNANAREANDDSRDNFVAKKKSTLLDRYAAEGKYPHDVAFQKWVIDHVLRQAGDNRPVNYYLAVLNSEYVYDGATNADGKPVYNKIDGQEIITFIDMNEIAKDYQKVIKKEIAELESNIASPRATNVKCDVGHWCAWGANTQCVFWKHCFQHLRQVPDTNSANKYLNSGNTNWNDMYKGKYTLVNNGFYTLKDIPVEWLKNENHIIQRDCYVNNEEYIDREKMQAWLDHLEYPIYHFDFESFPCPLPRFKGEHAYTQSCFEFSLHIEREAGVCDKERDNVVFLSEDCDADCREDLIKAIAGNFEFNEDGSLHGTMLAQNTGFEIGRLRELAEVTANPDYKAKLLAIANKTADVIHLLKTKNDMYKAWGFEDTCGQINYYHKDLSGSYSIKRTLPVLVPYLSYDEMKKKAVGNGVQAYVTYLSYDKPAGTTRDMNTKADRIEALRLYCQQDTWAMVEILRAVRDKIK